MRKIVFAENKISDGTNLSIDNTVLVFKFMKKYLERIAVFTADMADAFDGFSLLKLCQPSEVSVYYKHDFLKSVNPLILELLRLSNQHQFLARYLAMMDKSFLALMDEYSSNTLALQISIMMHGDVFLCSALDLGFQLAEFGKQDDKLGILGFSDHLADLGPTKANRSILCEFLVDPSRSLRPNFQSTGPRLYVMALLGCFGYLNKIIINEDCSIDKTWLYQHSSLLVLSEETSSEGRNATPGNNCDKINPSSSKEYATLDTENDIKAWQQGWRDTFEADECICALANLYELVSLSKIRCFILISTVYILIDIFFRTAY